ncbi:MAG: hypothetical protein ABIV43_01115 [Candidatus Saccharimonadales bacterium]
MKLMIFLGITIGGGIGSWLGAIPAHGNYFSASSIFLSGIGSLAGIWVGYKIAQNYLG